MTRGELSTRIQQRADRNDSTTQGQIDDWIDEVIQEIEKTYPLSYCKKSQTTALTASENQYTLPGDLILHHPFTLLLQDLSTSGATTKYQYQIKIGNDSFYHWFPEPLTENDGPTYYTLTGGTSGINFDVSAVPNQSRTLKLGSGYYYSGAFTADAGAGEGDSESSWLTTYYPYVVIEGVCAKLFEHYGEPGKADRAAAMYQAHLNGDPTRGIIGVMQAEKKMQKPSRPRVKTWDDIPLTTAIKMRNYGG